jgi:protein-L-isoaspartate O-methyltransferase
MCAVSVESLPAGPREDTSLLRLLRDAGIGRGMHVLDIGCGGGDVSLAAAELTGPKGLVLGIDTTPEILESARHRARIAGLDHVYFLKAGLEDLEADGPFDAIVVERVPEPPAGEWVQRLLRRGGIMIQPDLRPARAAADSTPHDHETSWPRSR